jgi:Restriction alleviation protein Lar
MSDLLNCPFCGGRAHVYTAQHRTSLNSIGCANRDCAVQSSTEYLPDEIAIAAWNRRAPVPLPEDGTEPTPGQIEMLCLSVQDVINGRLETGDAAADLAAVREHLDTALKLTGFDGVE